MSEPDWAKVLQQIYQNKNGKIKWPLQADGWEKSIDGTGLSFEQENEAIQFLHESGLLQKVDGAMDRNRQLTKRGFDVAHEREQNKTSEELNFSIVMLTAFLVSSGLIQAISGVYSVRPTYQDLVAGASTGILLITVILVGLMYYRR